MSQLLKESICSSRSIFFPLTLLHPEWPKLHRVFATIQTLCIGTDRSQQTVQTKIRLLLKKQSDQGLLCLPFHQHLLDALMQCYIKLFLFLGQLYQLFEVSQIIEFLRYSECKRVKNIPNRKTSSSTGANMKSSKQFPFVKWEKI